MGRNLGGADVHSWRIKHKNQVFGHCVEAFVMILFQPETALKKLIRPRERREETSTLKVEMTFKTRAGYRL